MTQSQRTSVKTAAPKNNKTATPFHGPSNAGIIRVFIVDDDLDHIDVMRRSAESDPKHDITIVGSASENGPELLSAVAAAKPDVVVVDGVLQRGVAWDEIEGKDRIDGIKACLDIRPHLPKSAKIILYTKWHQLKRRYRDTQCADHFLEKEGITEAFRDFVRKAAFGEDLPPSKYWIDIVVGLEVSWNPHMIRLIDREGKKVEVPLPPIELLIVHYLAKELRDGQPGHEPWLRHIQGNIYGFGQRNEYDQLCRDNEVFPDRVSFSQSSGMYEVNRSVVSTWCARINKHCSIVFAGKLVIGPSRGRGGRKEFKPKHYSLNPTIEPGLVKITPLRQK